MIQLTTASCCMENGCLGYPGAYTLTSCPMAGNPLNPAMSPHAVFQAPVTCTCTELTVEMGIGGDGPKDVDKQTNRCAGDCSIPRQKRSRECHTGVHQYNAEAHWACNTICIPLIGNTSYSLLLILLKVHLTAFQVFIDVQVDQLTIYLWEIQGTQREI